MTVKKAVVKKESMMDKKQETSRFVPPQVVVVEDEDTEIDPAEQIIDSKLNNTNESDAAVESKIIDSMMENETDSNTSDIDKENENTIHDEKIDDTEAEIPEKHTQSSHHSVSTEDNLEHTALDRQKEVVKELFKKKETLLDSEISRHEKQRSTPLVMWVVIVLTVAFLVSFGIIFTFRGGAPNFSLPTQASPTPTAEPTALVTPTPEISKKDLKIQVLNGNGEKGVAGTMKTALEDLGYTVSDTGNAGTYDYENTEITVKSGKTSIAELLKSDLTGKYIATVSEKTLDSASPYDVRIIVGKK